MLDASVLVALFEPADVHHALATALFEDQVDEEFVLHPLTCAEVLVGPTRRGVVDAVLHDLPLLGIRTDLPDADQPVRLAHLRATTGLRLPDCCVLDIAMVHRAPLATFDDRLATGARARGIDVLPRS